MPHRNKIQDSEPHFIINPSARTITNSSPDNNIIVQYDHNSERFTFEIPRYVDGHDMSECIESGEVRVNYRNSASTGLSKNDGVYTCEDLAVSDDDEDIVTFSWLLSSAATQYIGYLYFSIQFICFDGENIAYSWNTGIYKDITIVESINNIEQAVESDAFKELTDLVRETKETLDAAQSTAENVSVAIENANEAANQARASVCYVKKTPDGKLQILDADRNVIDTVDVCYMDNDTIYRYDNGVIRVEGIKELNSEKTLRMWIGTHAEYKALAEVDEFTLYMITNDDSYDDIISRLDELDGSLDSLGGYLENLEETLDHRIGEVDARVSNQRTALLNGNLVPKNATTADTAVDFSPLHGAWKKYIAGESIPGGVFIVRVYEGVNKVYASAILDTCNGRDTYVSSIMSSAVNTVDHFRVKATHDTQGYFKFVVETDMGSGWSTPTESSVQFEYKRLYQYAVG